MEWHLPYDTISISFLSLDWCMTLCPAMQILYRGPHLSDIWQGKRDWTESKGKSEKFLFFYVVQKIKEAIICQHAESNRNYLSSTTINRCRIRTFLSHKFQESVSTGSDDNNQQRRFNNTSQPSMMLIKENVFLAQQTSRQRLL